CYETGTNHVVSVAKLGHDVDLDEDVGQIRTHGGAYRIGGGEVLLVDGVELGKVRPQIFQVDGRLDDVVEGRRVLGQHGGDVGQHLGGLLTDARCDGPRLGVLGAEARGVQETAGDDPLAVRAGGCGGLVGADRLLVHRGTPSLVSTFIGNKVTNH